MISNVRAAMQKLVSLIIRCHRSWAVAAVAVFGVTHLGACAVCAMCDLSNIEHLISVCDMWHLLTYRTINFKRHLLHTNISLIHLIIIQTIWTFCNLTYCVCILYSWILCELQRIDIWENRKKKFALRILVWITEILP